MPDSEQNLLRRFLTDGSEHAFEGLVAHHIDMVFGCAMRRTGDAGLAEEISQNVFTILARKPHRLNVGLGLAGWLHKTTVYESAKALRGESRRQRKMKALSEHHIAQSNQDETHEEILQIVDEAMGELSDGDRQVVLLHYFEGRSFKEIAAAVGKSAAASQKQTSRALGKLGAILKHRGINATATTLGSVLTLESAKAAPVGISTLSGSALANASTLTASTLIANAIQTMTYAKTKIALLVTAAAAVPLGLQVSSIANLKEEVRRLETREAELVEREERLTKLEAKSLRRNTGNIAGGASNPTKGTTGLLEVGVDAPPQPAALTPFGSLAEMLKDPTMRTMLIEQMEVQLAATYGEFIDYLDLDDDKRSELSTAILDRHVAMVTSGVEGLEDGKELTDPSNIEELTAAKADHDARIKGLIGDARYEEFERFESSTSERQEIASFRSLLEQQGGHLPFETAQKLMTIMYEESMAPRPTDTNIDPLVGASEWTPEATASLLSDRKEVQESILSRVTDVLTPDQFKVFKENQASYLKLIETGMEMHSKLFQSPTE